MWFAETGWSQHIIMSNASGVERIEKLQKIEQVRNVENENSTNSKHCKTNTKSSTQGKFN